MGWAETRPRVREVWHLSGQIESAPPYRQLPLGLVSRCFVTIVAISGVAASSKLSSPRCWHPLWLLPAAAWLVHVCTMRGYGWFRDEFYYVACARHLAWGYVDQPPLSIAILAPILALPATR